MWHVNRLNPTHFVELCPLAELSKATTPPYGQSASASSSRKNKGKGKARPTSTKENPGLASWKRKQNWIRCRDLRKRRLRVLPRSKSKQHAFSEICGCVVCDSIRATIKDLEDSHILL